MALISNGGSCVYFGNSIVRCPYCKEDNDKVIDSRSSEAGRVVRRRRQCNRCGKRFTTYERIEESVKLVVIKKDGSRVPFSRNQIIAGVQKACYKRPVSMKQIDELAEDAIGGMESRDSGYNYQPYYLDLERLSKPLLGKVLRSAKTGEKLGNGARRNLYRIWEKDGKPTGDFNWWLQNVLQRFE